jgi:hypothetical protein
MSTGIFAISSSTAFVEEHAEMIKKSIPNKKNDNNEENCSFIMLVFFTLIKKFAIFTQSYMQKIE